LYYFLKNPPLRFTYNDHFMLKIISTYSNLYLKIPPQNSPNLTFINNNNVGVKGLNKFKELYVFLKKYFYKKIKSLPFFLKTLYTKKKHVKLQKLKRQRKS